MAGKLWEGDASSAKPAPEAGLWASAAVIRDLKQRGLLDESLAVQGGEIGRTPIIQGGVGGGRDHRPHAFTKWLADGSVGPGITLRESDEFGFHVVRNHVGVRYRTATTLHLLGLDHSRRISHRRGLDRPLAGVEPARVVCELLV